jgi:hypothetical protein
MEVPRVRIQINPHLEEKKTYNYFKSSKTETKRPKQLTGWRLKAGGGYSHQFYDTEALDELDEKESFWKSYLLSKESAKEKMNVTR